MPPHPTRIGSLFVLLSLAVLPACRESSPAPAAPIPPNEFGANGCMTPDNSFVSVPVAVPLATLQVAAESQVTAATDAALLFATGAGGQVVQIDVSDPSAPVEVELLPAAEVAALLASSGIMDPPVVSGIAVGDAETLLVIEHTANVVLAVGRTSPATVEYYAGLPSTVPGNADGTRVEIVGPNDPFPRARFSFEAPCQLIPIAPDEDSGQVFVVDSGNHSVRLISGIEVETLAGAGTPGTVVGDLSNTLFDTPSGISVTCVNSLLISELGDYGQGQVIRSLTVLGMPDFSGRINGEVDILVGDIVDATTEGVPDGVNGVLAQVSRPASPLATTGGDIYWVDSGTGVLRRLSAEFVDCPLAVDCATAVGAPSFTPGGTHCLTQTPNGDLYVLDSAAGTLFRIAN